MYGLHSSLTPQHVKDANFMEYYESHPTISVRLKDEVDVRRNLPKTTAQILEEIGEGS